MRKCIGNYHRVVTHHRKSKPWQPNPQKPSAGKEGFGILGIQYFLGYPWIAQSKSQFRKAINNLSTKHKQVLGHLINSRDAKKHSLHFFAFVKAKYMDLIKTT